MDRVPMASADPQWVERSARAIWDRIKKLVSKVILGDEDEFESSV